MDVKILSILQENGALGVKEVAAKIGLSISPTYERIRHLEKEGFILKYVALLNPEKIGYHLMVYCNITLRQQSKEALAKFEKTISNMEQVLEVISISGSYDYMLKIAVKDIKSYNELYLNELANIDNISQIHSNFVLSEIKKETAYFLDI